MTLVRSRRAYSLQITDAATSSELTCALCASHLGEPNHPKVERPLETFLLVGNAKLLGGALINRGSRLALSHRLQAACA